MNTIAATVVIVGMLCPIFCMFMIFRTQWVYRQRVEMLHKDYDTYREMPPFEHMMWRFWIWDVEKFIRK